MTGLAFPKPRPRCLTQGEKRRQKALAQRAVYAAVTKRDGRRCRRCGKPASEHHHIIARSLGGKDTTDNLLLLCRDCHDKVQRHVFWIRGNADGPIQVEVTL